MRLFFGLLVALMGLIILGAYLGQVDPTVQMEEDR